jgi:quercetin dioxygenase-like cupin family protein
MEDTNTELLEEWHEHLDAMTAAPQHHQVLLENDDVRVLDSRVRPGDNTPVHTHRWPAVLYVLGTSDFVRCDPQGNVIFDSRESENLTSSGQAVWSPALAPHFVKNIGETEIRVISIELKNR